MWVTKWHHNRLTSFKGVDVVIDGNACASLKNGDKCIATCAMACNLFACAKTKEGNADGIVLRKGLADDMARKACNLVTTVFASMFFMTPGINSSDILTSNGKCYR